MGGTSVSTSQMAMIAYSLVVRRERFFTYMTVYGAVKFFIIEIYHGYSGMDTIYAMC